MKLKTKKELFFEDLSRFEEFDKAVAALSLSESFALYDKMILRQNRL